QMGPAQLEPADIGLLMGFLVNAKYDAGTLEASEIHVEHAHVFDGTAAVTGVNLGARTLTLTSHGVTMTFLVPLGADLRLAGRPATLGDLAAGDVAHVHYLVNSANQPIALQIEVPGPKRQHA